MLTASCHCGAIRLEVSRTPRMLTDCNCSICRRYGALWAYYKATSVRVLRAPKATSVYSWGDKTLELRLPLREAFMQLCDGYNERTNIGLDGICFPDRLL